MNKIEHTLKTKNELIKMLRLMGATKDGSELIVYDGTIETMLELLELLGVKSQVSKYGKG